MSPFLKITTNIPNLFEESFFAEAGSPAYCCSAFEFSLWADRMKTQKLAQTLRQTFDFSDSFGIKNSKQKNVTCYVTSFH